MVDLSSPSRVIWILAFSVRAILLLLPIEWGYPENLERACSSADGGGKPDPTDRDKDWGDTLGLVQTRSFPLFSLGFGLFGGLESGCAPILCRDG